MKQQQILLVWILILKHKFILYFMINLIDQHGEFNERIYEFPNANATIAIFGSQSSGKSTLLNAAFGTYFPTLDSSKERKRCTKGMWLMNNGKYNVIDTEGFDSVERSSQMRIYQRQVALLCLAIADVIVVNIWMNQIGRYEGGQLHILKSIIKASNSILKSETKTILFVVKDCTRDADTDILKDQLEHSVKTIIQEYNTSKKTIKFNLEYYFMSHYVYQPHQYQTQAKKLPSTIKVKKSGLAQYNAKDRIIYIRHLWQTIIENDGQIDLRLQEEALRSFIVKRIRKDVQNKIQQQFKSQTKMGKRSTYERFYEYYIKKSFDAIRQNMPKYVDDKTIKHQYFLLEEQLGYEIQKHFTFVILPYEEQYFLTEVLDKELKKYYQSIQLQKIINKKRKEVLQNYKILVQGHKQASILTKRFSERLTETSVLYQRQVSHLFNMFQSKLETEINKQLDSQVRILKFDPQKLTQKVMETCKKFQYNQWQLNLRQIYQKASHRILTIKLVQKIQSVSSRLQYSMLADSKEPQIIAFHQRLSHQCQKFCSDLLDYFEQSKGQYIERSKEKVRDSLQKCLRRQKKRFKVTLIMLAIFLIFFYGEFVYLLKMGHLKKKSRRYMRYFYIIFVCAIMVGGIIKRRTHFRRQCSR